MHYTVKTSVGRIRVRLLHTTGDSMTIVYTQHGSNYSAIHLLEKLEPESEGLDMK